MAYPLDELQLDAVTFGSMRQRMAHPLRRVGQALRHGLEDGQCHVSATWLKVPARYPSPTGQKPFPRTLQTACLARAPKSHFPGCAGKSIEEGRFGAGFAHRRNAEVEDCGLHTDTSLHNAHNVRGITAYLPSLANW